jgi:hypothetical protein
MKTLKYVCLLVIGFAFIMGCSGDYGLVKRQPPIDNKMTLAELKENWEDYHIYYGKPVGSLPKNIMFDPKNNETRIVGDGWHKIADQQAFSETISAIQAHWDHQEIMIIEGPDKRFFGYMYCSWGNGVERSWTPSVYDVKLVDERTVHVFQGV